MAEGKKSFVLYTEWKELFDNMTDEQAGALVKHIFSYVNDEDPVLENPLLKMAFIPIRLSLKRDLKKWEGFINKQKANGAKGGRPRKSEDSVEGQESQKTQAFIEKPKKAVNVNVNVNANVNEKEKGLKSDDAKAPPTPRKTKEVRERIFRDAVMSFEPTYKRPMLIAFADYWTESNPGGTKMKCEMQKTFEISRRLKTWASKEYNQPKKKAFPESSFDRQGNPVTN